MIRFHTCFSPEDWRGVDEGRLDNTPGRGGVRRRAEMWRRRAEVGRRRAGGAEEEGGGAEEKDWRGEKAEDGRRAEER